MKKKILYFFCIIIGMLVLSYANVPQVLDGKIVNQSDISGWQGMSKEMMDWNTAVFRLSKSRRDSPGFWLTPAQMTTRSASAQSLESPA